MQNQRKAAIKIKAFPGVKLYNNAYANRPYAGGDGYRPARPCIGNELRRYLTAPMVADAHNIHFGVTTNTSQQTINSLKARFTDQRLTFSIISETGFNDYMLLYDPPKKVEYEDIKIAEDA
jgi:hypothetical protein